MAKMSDLSVDVIRERSFVDESFPIYVLEETVSTNTLAIEYAKQCPDVKYAVFIADCQSGGRGRLGRAFVSREGVGLYFSLLIRRRQRSTDALRLTTYTAVALSRVIERLTSLKAKIKWVNDIYIGEKKLAGILTEGRLCEDGTADMEYVIVGIGVNVKRQDMSAIDQPATDIESECNICLRRDALAGELLREMLGGLEKNDEEKHLEEYRSRSLLDNRRVRIIKAGCEREATVVGIHSDFSLHLLYDDGSEEYLNTGEVSTKLT